MPDHAGFAAAIAIRQETLRDLIRAFHHANQIPHTLVGSLSWVSANFYLEPPQLTCSAANGNRLIFDLTARGPLTITPWNGVPATRPVLLRGRVLARPQLRLQSGALIFHVDALNATLASLDIEPLAGGPYPAVAQSIIDGGVFRNTVESFIQLQLTSLMQLAPPLNMSFLGALANAPGTSVTAAVLDGVLALGIDVSGTNGVTTHGDAALLTDTTMGNDISMWINPAALPITMTDVRTGIETRVAEVGATLTHLRFGLIEGAFRINGNASKGVAGSVNFSLDAVPRLIRPGIHEEWDDEYGQHFEIHTPDREELWFEPQNVQVDIDLEWWAELLNWLGTFLTFGTGTMIVIAIVDMIRNNITSGIHGGRNAVAERVQEFTFAGISEPAFRLRIVTYECHAEGVFTAMTLRPQIRAPRLSGLEFISVEQAIGTNIRYALRLPFDAHPDDPMLSVRWTVRRLDSNLIIRNVDVQARQGLALDLTGEPALLEAPAVLIACRVYSTLGPIITDLFSASVVLQIRDRLDRSHRFVRWRHQVYTPVVRVEADGSHTWLGYREANRVSKIHRTAVPGRCRMVSRYSLKVSDTDDGSGTEYLEYLDTLPFPEEELVARRAVVCDYCFFGGPDKTVPLI